MTCKDLAPLLASLADGSLPPAEESLARAHLGSCAACRAAQGRFEKLEQLLGAGLSVPDPGEAYFKAQRARLLRSAAQGSVSPAPAELRRPRGPRFVWAAAAAILILAAGAAYWRGVPARAPEPGPTSLRSAPSERDPAPAAPPRTGTPATPPQGGIPWAPSPAPTAQKTSSPEEGPRPLPTPRPEGTPVLPPPTPPSSVTKEAPSALAWGASARLSAMTEESVVIGLAETPRDRVAALFGAAEARLGELGQVIRQDPGLASELAGAYLLLLGEGVRSVLQDGTESPQELALARRAARERARGHESALLELGAVAQGSLQGTLKEALAMSRELARP